jgi:drug/metabolite transporter (DMT)-like permease
MSARVQPWRPVLGATGLGTGLVLIYTGLISGADAITKFIAGGYAAPQLFCLSGLVVVVLSIVLNSARGTPRGLRTGCPRAMAVRAGATVVACTAFFYAFAMLPFAEVFLFIGLMPILSGILSGPVLGEHVRPLAWGALAVGFIGMLFLFPAGLSGVSIGHGFALLASLAGTISMIMARYIGQFERNALAQVFYPNLAVFAIMAGALPFVWVPMPLADLVWVFAYATLLFVARWVLVVALRLLAAYAVTPLLNLQFVWMVLLGAVFFGEVPATGTYLGAGLVVLTSLFLVWEQLAPGSERMRTARV